MAWIAKYVDELSCIEIYRARLAGCPWLQAPACRDACEGVDIARAQAVLHHDFRNPQLLAEALTHSSCMHAAVPSYERLAMIGECVIQCYVTTVLVRGQ